MKADFEVVAEGLKFPEGPVALADGSLVAVDILGGTIVRVEAGKPLRVVAEVGGGPNGAAIGPDGLLYVVNNGGFSGRRHANGDLMIDEPLPGYTGGWVDRVNIKTGRVERLLDSVQGRRLSGPNDIVFDREGGFWFTDIGKSVGRVRQMSAVYYVPVGSVEAKEVIFPGTSFNGIGLSPDQQTLYVADTFEAALRAYQLAAPGVLNADVPPRLTRIPSAAAFDSLAVQANGDVCVAMVFEGGVATISPSGGISTLPLPDRFVTNICFGGADMRDAYVTFSGSGRIVRMRWPEPGLRLSFNA